MPQPRRIGRMIGHGSLYVFIVVFLIVAFDLYFTAHRYEKYNLARSIVDGSESQLFFMASLIAGVAAFLVALRLALSFTYWQWPSPPLAPVMPGTSRIWSTIGHGHLGLCALTLALAAISFFLAAPSIGYSYLLHARMLGLDDSAQTNAFGMQHTAAILSFCLGGAAIVMMASAFIVFAVNRQSPISRMIGHGVLYLFVVMFSLLCVACYVVAPHAAQTAQRNEWLESRSTDRADAAAAQANRNVIMVGRCFAGAAGLLLALRIGLIFKYRRDAMRICPRCQSRIHPGATRCRYCQADLDPL